MREARAVAYELDGLAPGQAQVNKDINQLVTNMFVLQYPEKVRTEDEVFEAAEEASRTLISLHERGIPGFEWMREAALYLDRLVDGTIEVPELDKRKLADYNTRLRKISM